MNETLIKELLRINKPAVVKNMLNSWKNVPKTLDDLSELYGSVILKFRVVHIVQPDPVWESEGQSVRTSLKNFIEWLNSDIKNPNENPFYVYPREDYWIYSSYNYMNKCFPETSDIMKGIDWSTFGFEERNGNDSTFWLGSQSSYTPFHMDTYGCNLVAQVIGKKQWVLFPPEDSDFLYMSRIPYEESSIYGCVNVYNPDLNTFNLFGYSHPHVVTLEPGDVLFVPPRWWHYVTSVSASVSINTWIEVEGDNESRLEEAITMSLMSALIPTYDNDKTEPSWVNPGEKLVDPNDMPHLIKSALNKCSEKVLDFLDDSEDEDGNGPCPKSQKQKDCTDVHQNTIVPDLISENILPLKPMQFSEYYEKHCYHSKLRTNVVQNVEDPVNLKSIVNCFVHPDVVSCIAQKLKELRLMSRHCKE